MKEDPAAKAKRFFAKGQAALKSGRYRTAKGLFIKGAQLPGVKSRGSYWVMASYCDKLCGDLRGSVSLLRKAERCWPRSAKLKLHIGWTQLNMGKFKLAERALRKSIEIKPTAIAYIFLGNAIGRQGCESEAKECFEAAIELEPENEEAHLNLGFCHWHEGQNDVAEKHYRGAIELDSKYAEAHAALGSLLIERGLYQEARRHLRRSIRIEPDEVWPRLRLAIANWSLRRLKEAEEQYLEAIRIAPDDAYAHAVLGDFLSAERRGDPESYLTKALTLAPNDASVLYFMGKHLHRVGCDIEAIRHLKKAARKGHEGARERLGELLAKKD